MQVKQLMTNRPEYIDANATIREAAMRMKEQDRGFAPIGDSDKLIGVLTDRDLAIRAFTDGKSPDDKVSSVMSAATLYCYEDDDINDVLLNMQQQHVQRLLVLNNESDKEFVGIVTLSDIADKCSDQDPDTMRRIVECCKHYH